MCRVERLGMENILEKEADTEMEVWVIYLVVYRVWC